MADLGTIDFDIETAWLRRFSADAESNLKAFALRIKEALPEQAQFIEKKPLFGKPRLVGICVVLSDRRYTLQLAGSRLAANVALVVKGVVLNSRDIEPADWFAQFLAETQKATAHAKSLSQSLATFMTS